MHTSVHTTQEPMSEATMESTSSTAHPAEGSALSRLKHGFESRWGHQRKSPEARQRASSEGDGDAAGDANSCTPSCTPADRPARSPLTLAPLSPAHAYALGLRDGATARLGAHPVRSSVLLAYPALGAWDELVDVYLAGYAPVRTVLVGRWCTCPGGHSYRVRSQS